LIGYRGLGEAGLQGWSFGFKKRRWTLGLGRFAQRRIEP
jgi:hypothetical protein